MQSPCLKEATQVCFHGCCPSPFIGLPETQKTMSKPRSTSSTCRRNFIETTSSSFFPNTQFTNPESLPSLQESFTQFSKAYPQYSETARADQIRAQEYYHLSVSNHICLDYIGIGLFSHLQLQNQYSSIIPSASTSSPPPQYSDFPFFGICYKSVNLKSQLLHGGQGSELESSLKKKIMDFFNISENDYCMVFTANRSSAFKLLAESYPFQSSKNLLTVYDYQSEAVESMVNISEKKGAQIMSAEFTWPRLRIHSAKLRNMIVRKKKIKKTKGLFVFPLQSRVTGTSYSYQWMSMARENGWHVLLDACALGPKDMDSFGLSLIRPDFLICSFYKVFGENPTGFACLFVKRSTISVLEASTGTGIISLVPAKKLLSLPEDSFGSDTELETPSSLGNQEPESSALNTSIIPISSQSVQNGNSEHVETSDIHKSEHEMPETSQSGQLVTQEKARKGTTCNSEIECRCLDQVDSLGLALISRRSRFLINWLVNALMKLQHPNAEQRTPLVRIYGPRIKFDRGAALAFNVYDWKGEKIEPILVQKLADRSNISLSYGFLHQIWFPDKYERERDIVMERKKTEEKEKAGSKRTKANHIRVVTIALGFLATFEDIYRLWVFVAQFLDADFVEKERWRYTALNQRTVEV
ncbi:Molybdenum cofactor sulfurtransferase [Bertholletia excelsa]